MAYFAGERFFYFRDNCPPPPPGRNWVKPSLKCVNIANDCSTEIVVFNINEYVGRGEIMTVDAGDTIFVHMFGAYFGLAASR